MNRADSDLKAARLARKKTQKALAADAGVLQETLSKAENRGPSRGVVIAIRLARALDTTVEDLFGQYVAKDPGQGAGRTTVHSDRGEHLASDKPATVRALRPSVTPPEAA